MTNRLRILTLGLAALLLVGAAVAGYLWYQRPVVLTIAVAPGPERVFADKMAALLEQGHASVRLSVLAADSPGQALAHFVRHEADLAIMRTDMRVPTQARAIAVLDSDVLLVITGRSSRIKSMADLRGRHLAVLGEDGRNEYLFRQILNQYDIDAARTRTTIQTFAPGKEIDQLLAGGTDAVISFTPRSWIAKTSAFEQLSHRMGGFAVLGLDDSKALERKVPGLFDETIEAGLLSGDPRIPDDELSTVALQRVLIVRAKVSDQAVAALMRPLFENKTDLAGNRSFASRIEPPDTEKDALIAVHEGAVAYLESEEKGFFDRYSDAIYLVMSIGSIIGSLGLAVFTSLTRVKPRKASENADEAMALTDKVNAAGTAAELDIIETELEDVLRGVLRGLKNGTVSSDGIEAFRLAYEHARESLARRRHHLQP